MILLLFFIISVAVFIFIARLLGHQKKEYQSLHLMKNFYLYAGGLAIFASVLYVLVMGFAIISNDYGIREFILEHGGGYYGYPHLFAVLAAGLSSGILFVGLSQLIELMLDIKSSIRK